jgi:hypothetical protein
MKEIIINKDRKEMFEFDNSAPFSYHFAIKLHNKGKPEYLKWLPEEEIIKLAPIKNGNK